MISDIVGKGILYIVATPIGNLEDITFRAVRILKEVNFIAAEDTRHSLKLLHHYQINTPVISCHEHNEESRINLFIEKLSQGLNAALISDAGTPLISDPGYRVVKGVSDAGFDVIPIPGPCAAIAGLSVSSLPTDSFFFQGFINKKHSKRISELEELFASFKSKKTTIIFYESPNRIIKLIQDILSVMGDRPAILAREMTKHYEEYLKGSLSDILENLLSRPSIKGECVLFMGWDQNSKDKFSYKCNLSFQQNRDEDILNISAESNQVLLNQEVAKALEELDNEIIKAVQSNAVKISSLAKMLSRKYGIPRQEIYNRTVKLQQKQEI